MGYRGLRALPQATTQRTVIVNWCWGEEAVGGARGEQCDRRVPGLWGREKGNAKDKGDTCRWLWKKGRKVDRCHSLLERARRSVRAQWLKGGRGDVRSGTGSSPAQ